MSYIVKNCPCFVSGVAIKGNDKKIQTCNNYKIRELTHCSDITDCVIKQVIEKCRGEHEKGADYMFWVDKFAQEILQLFDIEEINK